ncbi:MULTISPECIES: BON domain-containing protein [Streptomyces]|uniref:BON domain-containing protein n=1 Tax=Streptomyces TaxID=1883 RepID=UPI0034137E14
MNDNARRLSAVPIHLPSLRETTCASAAEHLQATVSNGVITLHGRVRDTPCIPVAACLVRAVEGVVDVEFDVTGPDAARAGPTAADWSGEAR